MPVVCYHKPIRSTPRKFTPADLQRISKNLTDQGFPWWILFGSLMLGAGVGYLVCRLVRWLDFMIIVRNLIAEVSILLAAGITIRVIITMLTRFGIMFPPVAWAVAAIIAILVLVDRIIERSIVLAGELEQVQEIRDNINDGCGWIKEKVQFMKKAGKLRELNVLDRRLIDPIED